MITLALLKEENISTILAWNKNKDADYLFQWAGKGYEYPLTKKQILDKIIDNENLNDAGEIVFAILDEEQKMTGTVELSGIDREKMQAWVSRFLIGEEKNRNRGLGYQALRLLTQFADKNFGIRRFLLKVFDFNKNAIVCYEKAGFKIIKCIEKVRQTDNGDWGCYIMEMDIPD